jgi:hypothetical protein
LEEGDENSKLSKALAQVEELQKELTLEKEQRAAKEVSLAEEINQLQETEVAKENMGMLNIMRCRQFSKASCLFKGSQ